MNTPPIQNNQEKRSFKIIRERITAKIGVMQIQIETWEAESLLRQVNHKG